MNQGDAIISGEITNGSSVDAVIGGLDVNDSPPRASKRAAKTARKQHGRPFSKGRSGNPLGRPQGSKNRATIAAETLLDGEAEALTRKAIRMALAGDSTAMRMAFRVRA